METYEEILNRMTQRYTELTGIVPCEVSDIAIRLRVLAGEIYASLVNAQWLKRQLFADTAEGEYLDHIASCRGLERRGASYAYGEVIFSVSEAATKEISIPAGTVVATEGDCPLEFVTLSKATIPVGSTSVHAEVRATSEGRAYNVRSGTVRVIVKSVSGAEAVTNPDDFILGADAESDDSLRARIVSSYKNVSSGTNCAYYERVAMSVDGIASAAVVPRARGIGTVDIYVAGDSSAVSDEQVEEAQKLISELREVNVDARVLPAEPAYINLNMRLAVKDGYDFDTVKDNCLYALIDYIASRGAGGRILLTEAGDRVYHTEGVGEYAFVTALCSDVRLLSSEYPVAGTITITEGVE